MNKNTAFTNYNAQVIGINRWKFKMTLTFEIDVNFTSSTLQLSILSHTHCILTHKNYEVFLDFEVDMPPITFFLWPCMYFSMKNPAERENEVR